MLASQPAGHFNMNIKSQNSGFSILEVLVSLVVLSIGLIGVAAVQVNTMKFGQVSQQRSNASQQVMAISERMRSNLAGVREGRYALLGTFAAIPSMVPAASVCTGGTGCDTAQISRTDLNNWSAELARVLPSGRGVINATNAPLGWQITVMWEEKDLAAGLRSVCPPAVAAPAEVQCMTANFLP
jgi:type IV pilus assembly protein PilV